MRAPQRWPQSSGQKGLQLASFTQVCDLLHASGAHSLVLSRYMRCCTKELGSHWIVQASASQSYRSAGTFRHIVPFGDSHSESPRDIQA